MNLVVKNLPDSVNAYYLEILFTKHGEVDYTKVIYDRVTGEHKGVGFVEMPTDAEADKAIEELNGKEINGHVIEVEKAKPRKVNIWS
ncbi:MAG: RNA recognition motif-containing protein [Bacteroidia bacterium]|jgi:RNA recognition motif-containing protein